jgi:hypothetical protein
MVPSDDLHVDDETLALLALGEQAGTPADAAHLTACERCAHELADLRDVADLVREAGPAAELVAPAPAVWDRVAAELGLGARAHAAAHAGATDAADEGATAAVRSGATAPADAAPAAAGGPAVVVPLRARSRGVRGRWLAVAAAAGLVLGGAGATMWWRTSALGTVLASATLEPLPGWSETGSAQVRTAPDGTRSLVVDLDDAPGVEGYLEVWLLKPDVSGLVSLGTLDGTSGTFALPPGLDLAQFPVVDVSDEPMDGDPAHSGVSVVRGALDV